nr:hypothetical protein BaRGS_024584 [Batillaria attramentaria]
MPDMILLGGLVDNCILTKEGMVQCSKLPPLDVMRVGVVGAALPNLPDCQKLEDHVLDTTDPRALFGTNSEIGDKARPVRVGSLRQHGPIPTHHFAASVLKSMDRVEPIRVFPYEAMLDKEGVVWDAYTMERWSDPARTDLMQQQSAWEAGHPWVTLDDMGTNLKQMVSGPDGNPFGVFSGKSGVRVGFEGSGEPELQDFGDLYANFLFSGNGGSMEVPVVRGATLSTHIFHNANPVIKPYCLSSIAGQSTNFECPMENSAADGGAGYIDGSCHGNTLVIKLHNTKPLASYNKIQWAAAPSGQWSASHGMHNCDSSKCRLTDGGHTVEISVPNASGHMSFAVNFIGHYVLPWDWGNAPKTANCARRRRGVGDIYVESTCSSNRNINIKVHLSDIDVTVDKIQYALEPASTWHGQYTPPMHSCDASHCNKQGNVVTIHTQAPNGHYKLAVNIIGVTTIPFQQWLQQPIEGNCDGSSVYGGSSSHTGSGGTNTNTHTTHPPTNTHQTHNLNSNTKFLLELNEPGNSLPQQTRKFVLYFSHPVKARVDGGTSLVHFEPTNGGRYSGLVQLGYLGAGPRGDTSKNNYLDKYHGYFSYKPEVISCVSDSRKKAYLSFDWNPTDANKHPASGNLLMVTLPHQDLVLQKNFGSHLHDSVYGYKTYEGNSWLLDYDVQHTPVDPDTAAVNRVKQNSAQLHDITAAIQRDADNANLDAICSHSDSYNVGKSIGMVARLASISRAFGTNHYQSLDNSILHCLNKWLRIDDSLENMWKFHYDMVWGGLFLRATNGELNFGVDYGFPYYNDHHFHLGYFIYAMAYYVKHHQAWGQAHKDRIYAVARDVGNPSRKDSYFPVVRHQDYYNGFSWASGVVPGDRQEESASEGINCYHGLAALGDAFNDPRLKHVGQLHLAMEIASVRAHNKNHFPPMIQKFGVTGMVGESARFLYTLNWPCDPNRFPMRHACLVGIQVIPITAVSKYWMDQEWAGSIKNSCEMAIDPTVAKDYSRHDPADHDFRQLSSGWAAFCYAAMAPLDHAHQTRAANYVRDKRPQELVGGTGAASTLLFIYAST